LVRVAIHVAVINITFNTVFESASERRGGMALMLGHEWQHIYIVYIYSIYI